MFLQKEVPQSIHKDFTHTCSYCGVDIDNGIFNLIAHLDICTRDHPNVSIEAYRDNVRREANAKAEEERFAPVFKKMTDVEKNQYIMYLFSGSYDMKTQTVTMGSEAIKRYDDFKNSMYKKYENNS